MLKRLSSFPGCPGPVVTVVMDGYGISQNAEGNAITQARKPGARRICSRSIPGPCSRPMARPSAFPATTTWATPKSGITPSVPARSTSRARPWSTSPSPPASCSSGEGWKDIVSNASQGRNPAFPGPVLGRKRPLPHQPPQGPDPTGQAGRRRARCACTSCSTAATWAKPRPWNTCCPSKAFLKEVSGADFDARIASGGGRMKITMDRYEADWGMVEKGWKTHVLGEGTALRFGRGSHQYPAHRRRRRRRTRHRPGPAPVRHRRGRQTARHHQRRRQRGVLQLPRRPRHRNLARLRGRHLPLFQPRALAQGGLRRHAGIRRRSAHPFPLPGKPPGNPRHHGRGPGRSRNHAARHFRDPEVRARDLFLERQPQRQVRR